VTTLADATPESVRAPRAIFEWRLALESLRRPYPLSLRTALPMAALIALVPFYIFIAELMPGRTLYAPEIALDRLVPLRPAWAFVYGALYLFLILLPVVVVRREELIRRTLWTYLAVWLASYVCFLLYPTAAPRPSRVAGSGFAAWGLRFLYEADPPYNCFPSLHVAHSFVSAIASRRVHRGLGLAASAGAALVGISTLFTKQHYVLDVIAGFLLAAAAAFVFLRAEPRAEVPELDRRAAPALAVGVIAILALVAACFWVAYAVTGGI
jgi:membrane-associated phospholipid phosphatase